MPAILLEPAADAKVSRLEVFGPVTCVYGFETLDNAIESANSLPFAFQASIFSSEIGPALQAAERLDAAAVMIDDHTAFHADWMPFADAAMRIRHRRYPWTMKKMADEKMLIFRHAD